MGLKFNLPAMKGDASPLPSCGMLMDRYIITYIMYLLITLHTVYIIIITYCIKATLKNFALNHPWTMPYRDKVSSDHTHVTLLQTFKEWQRWIESINCWKVVAQIDGWGPLSRRRT